MPTPLPAAALIRRRRVSTNLYGAPWPSIYFHDILWMAHKICNLLPQTGGRGQEVYFESLLTTWNACKSTFCVPSVDIICRAPRLARLPPLLAAAATLIFRERVSTSRRQSASVSSATAATLTSKSTRRRFDLDNAVRGYTYFSALQIELNFCLDWMKIPKIHWGYIDSP